MNTIDKIITSKNEVSVQGLRGSSDAWFASQLAQNTTCCCIVPDDHLIEITKQNLQLFTDKTVLSYPGHEIPPYTPLSPDQQVTATRLSTLYQVLESDEPKIIVTSIEALIRRIIPKSSLTNQVELIISGEDCDRELLIHNLTRLGYEKVSLTKSVGDFSIKGGILDIFPPPFQLEDGTSHQGPIRLDFFGDTVESLRSYDPASQRSIGDLPEAFILPCRDFINNDTENKKISRNLQKLGEELNWSSNDTLAMAEKVKTGQGIAGIEFFLPIFFPDLELSSVFDFLPKDSQIVFFDPISIRQSMRLCYERIEQNFLEAKLNGIPALLPDQIFLNKEEIESKLQQFKQIKLNDLIANESNSIDIPTTSHSLIKQEVAKRRNKEGVLPPLVEKISDWQTAGDTVIICCRSAKHSQNLIELLEKQGKEATIAIPPLSTKARNKAELLICEQPISEGFSLPEEKIHLVSESDIFGQMRLGGKKKKSKSFGEPIDFTELSEGNTVVHRDHGIGIYRGLNPVTIIGITNDFMIIEYRDDDKLYLPVDKLNLVSRYQGLSDKEPKIDKLGTTSWKNSTKKIKEEIWKVAHELLDIYAKRELRIGRKFSAPGQLYHELEESFPFDETPGQDQAINDVIDDLTSINPTDRLVCGDVGFGKTEVAIRAAFKVVEDGAQVAVLVPTTVLAEQHLKTFRERLENFPVRVECLNRFRTRKEQTTILSDLGKGQIDIVIGTHRILSKDVEFKDLGLLIVDEEHRFGVAHKEKLRKMRAAVDIITLTATPIPRTLQMSLLSIRDLSIISSPPEQRRPIKTFVAETNDLVIKEAITKELRRKGQTFFVHNRVKSIYQIAGNIEKLVPDARIAIAHGQMNTKELEEIMVKFVKKEIDVLVATTIIESGLDIPSANTIIINRADRLGLAAMYQLRGRVGRSSIQSFAYLLAPSLDSITKDSRERLRALMECNELGGGYQLAMNDLQIRGGGNLLGISQSGNIAAIGYDLYLDLLQKTISDLKSQESEHGPGIYDELDPEINLQLSSFIPTDYIRDIDQRYTAYRRIAALSRMDDLAFIDIRDELEDRFGPIPKETENLLNIIDIKRSLIELRVAKLEKGKGNLVFTFQNDTPISPDKIIGFISKQVPTKKKPAPKLTQDGRLIIFGDFDNDKTFSETRKIITQLLTLI
ncbi:MAG: transcription-repair coupling factor [Desulfotalea sp.]